MSVGETLIHQFYSVLNSGDLDLLDKTLSPNWEEKPLAPGQVPGRDGYKPVVQFFRQAFPDVNFVLEDVIIADDKVIVRTSVTGTHRGPFLGVNATDRSITFRTIDIHRIADDLIVESWHIEDFFGLYQQLIAPDSNQEQGK